MKGYFLTKEHVNQFTAPLNTLSKIVDDGVVLNFSAAEKTVKVYGINHPAGVMIHLVYKDVFTDFDISTDEKVGIMHPNQFVKYFGISDQDRVLTVFDTNVFSIIVGTDELKFKTADPELIKESPKTFKGAEWFTTLALDAKFSPLLKAMSILADEDCLQIQGNKETGKVVITIRASDIEINSFKFTVDAKVEKDFESFYRKDVFEKILLAPCEALQMSFSERVVKFESKSKTCDITYYLAKKSK